MSRRSLLTALLTSSTTRREAPLSPVPRRLLLRRVFVIEILVCPHCGGARRILGAVTEPHAVRRLLAALGLAAPPPPGRPVTAS